MSDGKWERLKKEITERVNNSETGGGLFCLESILDWMDEIEHEYEVERQKIIESMKNIDLMD